MKSKTLGSVSLVAATIVIAATWMVILPRVSNLPAVRHRIENNRKAGINPTAVFYTDHPGMADIERDIQASVESSSKAFWKSFGR